MADTDMGFTCALSGLRPGADEEPTYAAEDDPLEDLPVGWTRVTLETRHANPEWILLQQLKAGRVEQLVQQVPAKQRTEARPLVEIEVRAQYSAFESTVSPYLVETEEVVLAPPSKDSELAKAWIALREMLGLVEPASVTPPAGPPATE